MKKLNVNDKVKVNELISEVEKNAKQRLIQSYELILIDVERCEKKLHELRVPKKYWVDCTIEIMPEKLPNSYKYRAEGTYLRLQRFCSDWFIIACFRGNVQKQSYGTKGNNVRLTLSLTAQKNIPQEWEI
jgi:hypothetical protein